jgi:hypothetical protein
MTTRCNYCSAAPVGMLHVLAAKLKFSGELMPTTERDIWVRLTVPVGINDPAVRTGAPYIDIIKPGQWAITGTAWGGMWNDLTSEDWSGRTFMLITNTPDLADPSTWTWLANYRAWGA